MAALLGVGEVDPRTGAGAGSWSGGGDVVIGGASGQRRRARGSCSRACSRRAARGRVAVASPTRCARSLSRSTPAASTPVAGARRHPEPRAGARRSGDARPVAAWTDTPRDRAWAAPDAGDVLRAMDRFHPIPDVPARARRGPSGCTSTDASGDVRFYLTFLVGPRTLGGRRVGRRAPAARARRADDVVRRVRGGRRARRCSRPRPDLTVGAQSRPARWAALSHRARSAGAGRRRPRAARDRARPRRPGDRWRRS